MPDITQKQGTLIKGVAAAVFVLAVALALLILAGVTALPIYIPIMLVIVASGLFAALPREDKKEE